MKERKKLISESKGIYLDGLFYKSSGVGRYYESLLKGLVKRGIKTYTCVPLKLKKCFELDFSQFLEGIEVIYVNYSKFSLKAFLKQGSILKQLELEKKVSLFHFPFTNLPLYLPKNIIAAVLDLRLFTEFWDRGYLKKKIVGWIIKRAIKKAKRIITISEVAKKEIGGFYPKYSSKIKMIYLSIDEKFMNRNKKNYPEQIVKDDYILFIGNRKKNKNLSRLIIAFDKIKSNFQNLKLVIAGEKDAEGDEIDLLKKKLNLKKKVTELISPSDEEIINLYKYAKAFVFPSLYEGFGLPPIEAMAIGTPVIASDIPVIKEVCGNGAYFFDPYDINDMAKVISEVLTNSDLRNYLIKKSEERVTFFSSEKAINQFVKIYQEVLSEKR